MTLVGDLKYGRTVHSLVKCLPSMMLLCSPPELKLPSDIYEEVERKGFFVSYFFLFLGFCFDGFFLVFFYGFCF